MQDTPIHILLGTDDRYLPGAVVTMASSIRATANDASFVFHVMDFGISRSNKENFLAFFRRYPGVSIVLHELDLSIFNRTGAIRFSGGGGYAAYARLLAPTFIEEDRVIYIDTDFFIQKDLSEIWKLSLDEIAFAACLNTSKGGIPNCSKMAFDSPFSNAPEILECPYFNSGFMLINMNEWRRMDFTNQALGLLSSGKTTRFADQTIINYLCIGKTKTLTPDWNTTPWWTRPVLPDCNLHFTSPFKPWTERFFLPAERIWFDFYDFEIKPHWDPIKTTRRKIPGFLSFARHYGIPALFPEVYCFLRRKFRKDSPVRQQNDLKQFKAMHNLLQHGLDPVTKKTLDDARNTIRSRS